MPSLPRRSFVSSAIVGTTAGVFPMANSLASPDTVVSGYGYRLPTFTEGTTLLFQGDSITDMKWDRNHYLGHSYVFLIASRLHTELPTAKEIF